LGYVQECRMPGRNARYTGLKGFNGYWLNFKKARIPFSIAADLAIGKTI